MHPDISLTLFGSDIVWKSYAVFTVLGALAAATLAVPMLRRTGMPFRRSLILLVFMAAGFLIGARLLNFLVNPDAYGGSLRLWTLRLKGFSLYGGITGAFAALFIWLRLNRVKARTVLDAMTLPFGVSFALARVGCYLNGCCGGKPTNSVFGVVFPSNQLDEEALPILSGVFDLFGKPQIAVYPTQLFEMALALLGLVTALILYFRGKSPPGTAFLIYGVWFSAMRLAVLPFRSLPYPDIVVRLIYPLLYAGTALLGIFLLIHMHRNRKGKPPAIQPSLEAEEKPE